MLLGIKAVLKGAIRYNHRIAAEDQKSKNRQEDLSRGRMLIKKIPEIRSSEITPRELYLNRRQFMLGASASAVTAGAALAGFDLFRGAGQALAAEQITNLKKSSYSTSEKQNSFKDITNYNNFYELGPDKEDRRQTPST